MPATGPHCHVIDCILNMFFWVHVFLTATHRPLHMALLNVLTKVQGGYKFPHSLTAFASMSNYISILALSQRSHPTSSYRLRPVRALTFKRLHQKLNQQTKTFLLFLFNSTKFQAVATLLFYSVFCSFCVFQGTSCILTLRVAVPEKECSLP